MNQKNYKKPNFSKQLKSTDQQETVRKIFNINPASEKTQLNN